MSSIVEVKYAVGSLNSSLYDSFIRIAFVFPWCKAAATRQSLRVKSSCNQNTKLERRIKNKEHDTYDVVEDTVS